MSDPYLSQTPARPTLVYSPYSIDSKEVDPFTLERLLNEKKNNSACQTEAQSPDEKGDFHHIRKDYARRGSVWTLNSLRPSYSLTDIPKKYQLSPYQSSRSLPLLQSEDTKRSTLQTSFQLCNSERKYVPPLLLLGPVVIVLLITAGMGTLLLMWIFLHKLPLQSPGVIYLHEGEENELGRQYSDSTMGDDKRLHFNEMSSHPTTLSLSSVVVFLIGWSLYPMMGLIAYGLAADWLQIQEYALNTSEGEDELLLPTPSQYALLSRICCANDITSLYDALKYWAIQSKKGRGIPSMLKKAIIWLAILILLQVSIAWLDFVLHETTRTVSVINVDKDKQTLPFSMAINQVLCPSNRKDSLPCLYSPSFDSHIPAAMGSFAFNTPLVASQGWLSANQESELYAVRLYAGHGNQETYGGMAFYTHPKVASYYFLDDVPSIGLMSRCEIVTDRCRFNSTDLDCSNIGRPELSTSTGQGNAQADALYSLDTQGFARLSNDQMGEFSNPYMVSGLMTTTAVALRTDAGFLKGSGNAVTAASFGAFVCNLTFYDLTLSYFNDTYSIETANIADAAVARDLSGPLLASLLTNATFAAVLASAGKVDKITFSNLLESSLSFNILAFSAGLIEQRPTIIRKWSSILAQQYNVCVLLTYIALLYSYAMAALLLFFWAWATSSRCIVYHDEDGASREMPMVVLTQRLLMDPSSHLITNYLRRERKEEEGLLLSQGGDMDTSDDQVEALHEKSKLSEKILLDRIYVGLNDSGRSFGVWPLPRQRSSALHYDD